MKTLVIGYYDRCNFGDELYKVVIPQILSSELTFVNIFDLPEDVHIYDNIIIGGGDVFNDYFIPNIKIKLKDYKGLIIGISVGMPFKSYIIPSNTEIFDHIFTRNKLYLEKLQLLLGSDRVHYLPDLAFKLYDQDKIVTSNNNKNIGVFLARDLSLYQSVVHNFLELFEKLKDYQFHLYAFDTSNKIDQNDRLFNEIIHKKIKNVQIINTETLSVNEMMNSMKILDYGICVRFHSAIFCTLLGIPFISISATNKVSHYMYESGLSDMCVEIERNRYYNPDHFDVEDAYNRFVYIKNNHNKIKVKLINISKQNNFLLDTNQIQNLLLNSTKTNHVVPNYLTLDRNYIYRKLKLDGSPRDIAEKMCYMITGDPCSDYIWGTIENIKNMGVDKIREMIDWIADDNIKNMEREIKLNIEYTNQKGYNDIHRSGWKYVTNNLKTICGNQGIMLDLYLDKTFGWAKEFNIKEGIIPYTGPWMGFIHHTFENEFSIYNNQNMISSKEFLQSLPTCKGLYVLSKYLQKHWIARLTDYNIPVYVLTHPTEMNCPLYNPKFLNSNYSIVAIGSWLRDPLSIYRIKVNIPKFRLKGKHMDNYFPPKNIIITRTMLNEQTKIIKESHKIMCRPDDTNIWMYYLIKYILEELLSKQQLDSLFNDPKIEEEVINTDIVRYGNKIRNSLLKKVKKMIDSIKVMDMVDNKVYDTILSSNVIYLKFIDISACNTLVECIFRNTPVIVNPHPSVIELLGKGYPLYFNHESEVGNLVKNSNIKKAYTYLTSLNKERYKIDTFLDNFKQTL